MNSFRSCSVLSVCLCRWRPGLPGFSWNLMITISMHCALQMAFHVRHRVHPAHSPTHEIKGNLNYILLFFFHLSRRPRTLRQLDSFHFLPLFCHSRAQHSHSSKRHHIRIPSAFAVSNLVLFHLFRRSCIHRVRMLCSLSAMLNFSLNRLHRSNISNNNNNESNSASVATPIIMCNNSNHAGQRDKHQHHTLCSWQGKPAAGICSCMSPQLFALFSHLDALTL